MFLSFFITHCLETVGRGFIVQVWAEMKYCTDAQFSHSNECQGT
jgi:hypothetical protein